MTQSGSGVVGLSSYRTGFIQSGLVFNLGRHVMLMSSKYETFTLSVIASFYSSAATRVASSDSNVLCYGGGGFGLGCLAVMGFFFPSFFCHNSSIMLISMNEFEITKSEIFFNKMKQRCRSRGNASTNIVHEFPSPVDAETGADSDKTTSETAELDEGQARSDPGKTLESRPPPEQEFMEEDQAGLDPRVSRVALAGPNPEPTHKEFMDNMYPDVHGSLKLPVDEHVILEEPLSSSETLSSMKNLDDA
nr:hypothetical protein [Tanacetum cinerariifolium]